MIASTETIIANALRRFLEVQIRTRPASRTFFRVSDFSIGTYMALLDDLCNRGWRLADKQLEVRSIDPIGRHTERTLDRDRSPTWYRNHLQDNHALVLIQNRRTSDAQSLKDLYPITALALSTDGLAELIEACFVDYQLNQEERQQLANFVHRLGRVLYQSQLRDLTEFLAAINHTLCQRPGTSLNNAITESLPHLGLFRCRDLANHLNTPRGDKLLRQLRDAARIGSEVLDDRDHDSYLRRLQDATLDDDASLGGLSAEHKRNLLHRFIDGQLRNDHAELLQVLQIDWSEVQLVISAKSRVTRGEKLAHTAAQLEEALAGLETEDEDLRELINDLREGSDPESIIVDRVLAIHGDSLNRSLRNELRRMVKARTRKHADFLVGLMALAVELIQPLRGELPAGTRLRVSARLKDVDNKKHLLAALEVFHVIYGGIEQALPVIDWQLQDVWLQSETSARDDTEEDAEKERLTTVKLPFRMTLSGPDDTELGQAELIWQYRSDSPANATAQTLAAELNRLRMSNTSLRGNGSSRLRVPVFNNCPTSDEIGDLDIRRPIQSLGVWFERTSDLRSLLEAQTQGRLRAQSQSALDKALTSVETTWAGFVAASAEHGLFAADSDSLIAAYENLLHTAVTHLTTGQEVSSSYRVLNQAWMIGPLGFEGWAVMPLFHPLKLIWWRERARLFDQIISRLLDPSESASIVDEPRYCRELAVTYGSGQFPPLLALPPGEGRPAKRFLPAEEADGYELYVRETVGAEAFGLDTDLLAEDENAIAAQRAVEGIAAVLQDYIETYPFVRDGLELVLFACRNGAFPGLLVKELNRLSVRRGWKIRLSLIVHTSDRGAPLFRRVSEWVQGEQLQVIRHGNEYFPPISLKVIEAPYKELLRGREDTDIVILADVLADQGQRITAELTSAENADEPLEGYLPTHRAQQEPFQQGELHRKLLLNPLRLPAVARYFLLAQYAAIERRPVKPHNSVRFYRELTLDPWEQVIGDLHDHFNWVICYDPTVDRFLLESTFPDKVQVIRYSLGLGEKRQHNLTVSSSRKAQDIVVRRLATRLSHMFHRATPEFLHDVAKQLVLQAKQVSGDIVLRAAGPGAFLNELIGLVVARFETERRYREAHPNALTTWILLDDFEHWFSGGKFPDLLFIAITRTDHDMLHLYTEVLEAKCVGQSSFDIEARDAERQVLQGVGRLAHTFAKGGEHLDALYWYDQLYRAVIGNLAVRLEQQDLWELFRDRLHRGNFNFTMEGHCWVFCYDGQAGVVGGPEEHDFAKSAGDLAEVQLRVHRYGRKELAQALRELVETAGECNYPSDLWESLPTSPVSEPPEPPEAPVTEAVEVPVAVPPVPPPSQLVSADPAPVLDEAAIPSAPTPPLTPLPAPDLEPGWLEQQARALERALRLRNIQVLPIEPAQADIGPSIVRFKLRLRPHESLKRLQNIAEDLARDLALPSTPIIANVARSHFVGIDIPRERSQVIPLQPLLEQLDTPGSAELPIIVGITPDGSVVIEDLAEFPHLLVAGATNSGKSVFLRSLLLSLMTQYRPGALEVLIIDPKRTDFTFFDRLSYLRSGKVITDRNEARDALLELVQAEMPRRQDLIAHRSTKIKIFNQRYPDEALPPIVALIDEYALLVSMMNRKAREAFEQDLMILAAAARSVGIHLVLATQRPSADIVTSTLKANLDARIAFRVASSVNSRVVLDEPGAENLLGRGDLLFRRPSGEIIRLQSPFMDEVSMQQYIAQLVAAAGH